MRALVFDRTGEPAEVLAQRELPDPVPGPGQAIVRVRLAPVHPSDLHILRGRYGRQPRPPARPGLECVGTVKALGPDTDGPAPGTRVVLLDVWGTWRDLVLCDAERLVPVPDGVADEVAAQALVNPVTAWALAMEEHRMRPGDWLLQTAAGSTVGRLVLQLARSEGFRTINVVRRRAQAEEIRSLGGDVVLCTEDEDLRARILEVTDGKGISHAIDCVAGRTGADVARSLAPGGSMLVYGALSSHRQTEPAAFEMPIFAPRLIYAAASVRGWWLFHWLPSRPVAEAAGALRAVLEHLAFGGMALPPAALYPLSAVGEAMRDAEAMGRGGKPLLDFRAN